ncbi:sugar-binding domain-containing protein [Luteolibacter algae]|uniref:Sugar-binding domain-containing protein n=1 Tax=Luteolibacter algae TaxID=454151 RepID=A0ABW5D989_9BACT
MKPAKFKTNRTIKRLRSSSSLARLLTALVSLSAGIASPLAHGEQNAEWEPAPASISSRWGEDVTPENVWEEYPRPQLVRDGWKNLNGLWNYKIGAIETTEQPKTWDGKILVPFALESSLSGVGKRLDGKEALWYQKTFEYGAVSGRLLLNFEAVDHTSTIWVNGQEIGKNVGGNLPFSLDITEAVKKGSNEIVLRVEDSQATAANTNYGANRSGKVTRSGILQCLESGKPCGWKRCLPHIYSL